MQKPHSHHESTADAGTEMLQRCLRTELSAVETYELALKSVTHVGLHHTLQEILTSHARRVDWTRAKLGRLGIEPVQSSGTWGAFAKAVQTGADLLGDRATIAALEEGEDLALKLYTEGLEGNKTRARKFIDAVLLPKQKKTHALCRTLQDYVKGPS